MTDDPRRALAAKDTRITELENERRALWTLLNRQTRRRRTWERRTRANADVYQRNVTEEINRAAGMAGRIAEREGRIRKALAICEEYVELASSPITRIRAALTPPVSGARHTEDHQ